MSLRLRLVALGLLAFFAFVVLTACGETSPFYVPPEPREIPAERVLVTSQGGQNYFHLYLFEFEGRPCMTQGANDSPIVCGWPGHEGAPAVEAPEQAP